RPGDLVMDALRLRPRAGRARAGPRALSRVLPGARLPVGLVPAPARTRGVSARAAAPACRAGDCGSEARGGAEGGGPERGRGRRGGGVWGGGGGEMGAAFVVLCG